MTRLAFGAALAVCLLLGLGDIADERVLTGLRWLELAPGVLLIVAALWTRRRPALARPLMLPLAVWLIVLALSAVTAPSHRADAIQALARPASGALLACAVVALSASQQRYLVIARALAIGGLLVALIGLLGMLVDPVAAWLAGLHDTSVPVADVPRLIATLSHPNVAAVVLELTFPLTLAYALSVAPAWRGPWLALAGAHLLALILTFSRAALLAEVVGLGLLALVAWRRRARGVVRAALACIAVVPVGLAAAALLTPQVARRLTAELQSTSYQAVYAAPEAVTVAPEQVVEVPVRVTNVGDSPWTAADPSRVALGYHLLRGDGTPLEFDAPATLLPADVAPQSSLDITAHLYAPAVAGAYVVEWDALREGVAWFSWRGSPTVATHLVVEPGAGQLAGAPAAAEVALPRPARVQFWSAAVAMLADYPLLGLGPDNFRVRFAEYSGVDEAHIGTHAHNLYLEALADTGVVGLVALLVLQASLLRLALRGLPAHEPFSDKDPLSEKVLSSVGSSGPGRWMADSTWLCQTALAASLTAWLLHSLFDDLERFLPAQLAWWTIAGLAARGFTKQTSRPRTDRA